MICRKVFLWFCICRRRQQTPKLFVVRCVLSPAQYFSCFVFFFSLWWIDRNKRSVCFPLRTLTIPLYDLSDRQIYSHQQNKKPKKSRTKSKQFSFRKIIFKFEILIKIKIVGTNDDLIFVTDDVWMTICVSLLLLSLYKELCMFVPQEKPKLWTNTENLMKYFVLSKRNQMWKKEEYENIE